MPHHLFCSPLRWFARIVIVSAQDKQFFPQVTHWDLRGPSVVSLTLDQFWQVHWRGLSSSLSLWLRLHDLLIPYSVVCFSFVTILPHSDSEAIWWSWPFEGFALQILVAYHEVLILSVLLFAFILRLTTISVAFRRQCVFECPLRISVHF